MARRVYLTIGVLLLSATQFASAQSIEVGYGPVLCVVPLDGLNVSECAATKVVHGNGGRCTMTGNRGGKDFTVAVRGTKQNIPFRRLPLLAEKTVTESRVTFSCRIIAANAVTGTCSAHGGLSGGSGQCTYCVGKDCKRASATVSIREKRTGKTFAAQ